MKIPKPTKKTILIVCTTVAAVIAIILGNMIFSYWARHQYAYNSVCMEIQSQYDYYREGTDYRAEFLFDRESHATTDKGQKYDRDYYYRVTWLDMDDIREETYIVRWIGYFKDTEVTKVPTEKINQEEI